MNLVIRATSLAGAPLSQSITGYFDMRGGTIGRSDTNTLALPDPERHISRLQAEIWHADNTYRVRNVGTANAIMHNDRRIAPGASAVLRSGDELQIGTYVLTVQEMRDNETAQTITRGRVVEPHKVIASSASEGRTDPHLGTLPNPGRATVPRSTHPFSGLLGHAPGNGTLVSAIAPWSARRDDDSPMAQTIPAARLRSLMQAATADDAPPGPVQAPPTPAAHAPETPAGPPATADALWAAFAAGAGLSAAPPQGLSTDLMRLIGTLLRHSIAGTHRLIAARAVTKQELHPELSSLMRSRHNNPLKLAPDAQVALEQLLQPPPRGFMPAGQAVADAMDDLLGQGVGTMAGTHAALDGVLARFAPDQLEAKLAGRSVLDTLVPMNRRAKLWELYLQHFERVRAEAHDDFHSLFGKAFVQAYEQQLHSRDTEHNTERDTGRDSE